MLAGGLLFLLALVLFVCIHETGHVVAARLCGYARARFALVYVQQGKITLAVTDAPLHLFSDRQNIWISLAGVLTTRICAELLLWSGPSLASAFPVFWISLFVLLRTDFAVYALRNLLGNTLIPTPQHDQDMSLAAQFLQQTTGQPALRWLVLFGALGLLDLWWFWVHDLQRVLTWLL